MDFCFNTVIDTVLQQRIALLGKNDVKVINNLESLWSGGDRYLTKFPKLSVIEGRIFDTSIGNLLGSWYQPVADDGL